jgi:hypothetical protein
MNDNRLKEELTAMSNAITPTPDAPSRLQHEAVRRTRRNRIVGTAAAAACAVAAVGAFWAAQPDPAAQAPAAAAPAGDPTKDPVMFGHALEQVSNSTADDWATVADRVVVGTVKSEKLLPPTTAEAARGEGLLGRTVTIAVERTVWSRQGAPAVPAQITLSAVGSTFSGGVNNNRRRLAYHDASRVETAHRYVFAIRYVPANCDEGQQTPARWAGIGSGGVIPFDTATLGTGEVEGAAKAVVPPAENGDGVLRAQMKGKAVNDLKTALDTAKARPRPAGLTTTSTSC